MINEQGWVRVSHKQVRYLDEKQNKVKTIYLDDVKKGHSFVSGIKVDREGNWGYDNIRRKLFIQNLLIREVNDMQQSQFYGNFRVLK